MFLPVYSVFTCFFNVLRLIPTYCTLFDVYPCRNCSTCVNLELFTNVSVACANVKSSPLQARNALFYIPIGPKSYTRERNYVLLRNTDLTLALFYYSTVVFFWFWNSSFFGQERERERVFCVFFFICVYCSVLLTFLIIFGRFFHFLMDFHVFYPLWLWNRPFAGS